MRVNVHLIDANTNIYLWSEKYDRELQDVFAVQDDITTNIVTSLSVKLVEAEQRRTARKYTTSIDAYDDFLKGQALYVHRSRQDNLSARKFYQQAIDRDATFARAYSAMAMTYATEHRYGWGEADTKQLEQALRLAKQGVSLDRDLPQAHWVLGYVHLFKQEYRQAAAAAQRAIELEPNYADSYLTLAICKIHAGAPDKALPLIRKAMLLNPEFPTPYASVLGQAWYFMEQYDQAVPVLREAIDRNINLLTAHVFLIASLSKLDQLEEASWAVEQLKTVAADISANNIVGMLPVQDADFIADMKKQLQRAGL